jgi:hypothetical protein
VPVAVNTIDEFTFIWMSEPPWLNLLQNVTRVRPGNNGVLEQTLGEWSEPFELITKAEAQNHQAAWDLYVDYRALVGGDAVEVVWCSIPMSSEGHVYFVKGVWPIKIRRIVHGEGPNGSYFAEAICRWRLQPVTDLPPG